HADLDGLHEGARGAAIAREHRRAIGEFVRVDERDGRLERGYAHHHQHRGEDLFAIDAHRRRHAIEQTTAEEEAVLEALDLEAAPINHQARAFLHAVLDVAADAVAMR